MAVMKLKTCFKHSSSDCKEGESRIDILMCRTGQSCKSGRALRVGFGPGSGRVRA